MRRAKMLRFGVPKYFKRISVLCFIFTFVGFASGFYKEPVSRGVLNIDEKLLNALIFVESSNNHMAYKKRTGARGLTQITRRAWKDLARNFPEYRSLNYKKDIFRPDVARKAGRDYLELLLHYMDKKDIPLTLENLMAAYNWGIKNLSSGFENAPAETRRFVEKVKSLL